MSSSDLVSIRESLLQLTNGMAAMVVVALLLTRIVSYSELRTRELSRGHRLLLVLVFGLFTIHATHSGFSVLGASAHVRDLGPVIAGLAGGPAVGLATGLIGAAHRYLQGGFTVVPCTLATILAGVVGGVMYRVFLGRPLSIRMAVLIMVALETVHMGMVLLLARPFEQAVRVTSQIAGPILLANAAGIALFAYVFHNLLREREVQTARERIESELAIATEIQTSVLPRTFPPFPDRPEFDIYACMRPAREVGGDFYDFFFIDDEQFCFVIGDVSDKGVPAALFMMMARTHLRTAASLDPDPSAMLERANQLLNADNASCMFVTVLCVRLNVRTGELRAANAGHNPPLLGRSAGEASYHRIPAGFVAGGMPGTRYPAASLTLSPGDLIYLYTDGVTEARNGDAALYGDKRLLETFTRLSALAPQALVEAVLADVQGFAAGAPQSDDITMLALRYRGPAAGAAEHPERRNVA